MNFGERTDLSFVCTVVKFGKNLPSGFPVISEITITVLIDFF